MNKYQKQLLRTKYKGLSEEDLMYSLKRQSELFGCNDEDDLRESYIERQELKKQKSRSIINRIRKLLNI